jgi:deazaflavin-dependent oxidoreductase (nitroreductase family)
MRSRKYRVVTGLERLNNRMTRFALHRGIALSAFALLETTGRRSGLPRYTPIGNGLAGDTFWLIAAHGSQADYVRNLQANPNVRVKVGRRWRSGTAVPLPDDGPVAHAALSVGRGHRTTHGVRATNHPHRPRFQLTGTTPPARGR